MYRICPNCVSSKLFWHQNFYPQKVIKLLIIRINVESVENSDNIILERFRLCYKKKLDIRAAKHKAKFSLAPTKVTSNCRVGTSITLITSAPSMQCYDLEMLIFCCFLVLFLLSYIVTDEKARNGTRDHPKRSSPGPNTLY